MSVLCTRDLETHGWRCIEKLLLGLPDIEGFYQCFLVWECGRCLRRVWADGVLHQTTPALSPVSWERITNDTTNPWQQQVEILRRETSQREALQAKIHQWTLHKGRHV